MERCAGRLRLSPPRRSSLCCSEVKVSSQKDPPSEFDIIHPAHPEHKPKLRNDCGGGQSLHLHERCALTGDRPLFDPHTLVHPLFGYGKEFEFHFAYEPPSSSPVQEEGRRVCDACGEATRGFVYHCSEQDVDLHPRCASLPDRIIQDGRVVDLHRRASRPCALCPENEGRRRWFWAYRCNLDGETVIDLHVACLKETARRSWEACYRDQGDVGDGALNVDSMLENKFGEIAGTNVALNVCVMKTISDIMNKY